MTRSAHLLTVLLTALTAQVLHAPEAAAEPATARVPREVRVEAVLVRATRGTPHVDPALQGFAADLRALPFQHFDRLASASWHPSQGASVEGDLDDVHVAIRVEAVEDKGVTLVVDLTRAGRRVAHTTVQRPWGRAHVLTVGSDGGATLVVPVRVTR